MKARRQTLITERKGERCVISYVTSSQKFMQSESSAFYICCLRPNQTKRSTVNIIRDYLLKKKYKADDLK